MKNVTCFSAFMEILLYNELNTAKVKKQFDKGLAQLRAGDFKSADVKKMTNKGFYRAKLDDNNRLLFKYAKIEGKTYLLILEVILNHDYENSRFLSGAKIDENSLEPISNTEALLETEATALVYVNSKQKHFHILDKILSFDEIQEEIFYLPSPLIIISSAGSGKTALTLEKIKMLKGKILYTTLSSFLVENSQRLYYSNQYDNIKQEVDFMSFKEYLFSWQIPKKSKELDYYAFHSWATR